MCLNCLHIGLVDLPEVIPGLPELVQRLIRPERGLIPRPRKAVMLGGDGGGREERREEKEGNKKHGRE